VTKNSRISHDNFEQLLFWLDADREAAGHRYETIRARLIKIFLAQKFCAAEELADETIDRVAGKVNQIHNSYEGEPARYFYAVARNVMLENHRKKLPVELPQNLAQPENNQMEIVNINHQCLDLCLKKLPAEKKRFIIEYYQGEKSIKLERRQAMADKEGISNHVLRNRALRLRANLQKCVLGCVSLNKGETFSPQTT